MALPAHLAHIDRLIDLLVDAVARELEAGTDVETPRDTTPAASTHHHHDHEQHDNRYTSLASGATL
jgi:Ni,Fe-hydrogenase maturation factor